MSRMREALDRLAYSYPEDEAGLDEMAIAIAEAEDEIERQRKLIESWQTGVYENERLRAALRRVRDGNPSVTKAETAYEQWEFACAVAAIALTGGK